MTTRTFFRSLIIAGLLTLFSGYSARADIDSEPDTQPVPIKTPPPDYPVSLYRKGISGTVDLLISIDEKGDVFDCSISKSSRSEFNKPTLKAVKQWKFKPAMKDGVPVKYQLPFPIDFIPK